MNKRSLSMTGLYNMQVVLEMFWKMILLEGWKLLFTNFQANTIRRFCKRTQDASPTCSQLRSLCIGSLLSSPVRMLNPKEGVFQITTNNKKCYITYFFKLTLLELDWRCWPLFCCATRLWCMLPLSSD